MLRQTKQITHQIKLSFGIFFSNLKGALTLQKVRENLFYLSSVNH